MDPANNFGNVPGGYDLRGYAQIRFRARSTTDGAQVKFLVGGVTSGAHPSSVTSPVFAIEADQQGFVKLSNEWREYHVDLRNADLSHVIDGFGWVAERARTPGGVTLYVDEIVFDRTAPPTALASSPPSGNSSTAAVGAIYSGRTLSSGYDMGVDTSGHRYDWVTDRGGAMELRYPPGQSWGAVFTTVGKPSLPRQRQGQDFSGYRTLVTDLRGERGGEVVYVGIKDTSNPDDGTETKLKVTLTGDWQTCRFPLQRFVTADLKRLYIPAEFVFEPGTPPETVQFRNIQYLTDATQSVDCK